VLVEAFNALESAGARVRVARRQGRGSASNAVVTLKVDGIVVELAVVERRHAPYQSDIPKLSQTAAAHAPHQRPMLVVPFVSPRLGDALVEAGWSWADEAGNFDIKAPGLRLRQRLVLHRPPARARALPSGAGSTAIIRWLLSEAPLGEHLDPSALMEVGHVSQPRISQLLRGLTSQELLVRDGRKYRLEALEPLVDAFLAAYEGPGGSTRFAYTLEEPSFFAAKASEILSRLLPEGAFAFSADVGPDLLAPWRRPTHTVVYVRESIAPNALGLVDAHGLEDANVLLRMPSDASLLASVTPREIGSTTIPLVDVPQLMWDLLDLGGEDRQEAVGRLREWFIHHRQTSSR